MKANQALAIAIANAKSVAPGAITSAVEDWLDEHVDPDTGYVIDDTLSTTGAAADAKKTGDEIADLKSALNETEIEGYTKGDTYIDCTAMAEKTTGAYCYNGYVDNVVKMLSVNIASYNWYKLSVSVGEIYHVRTVTISTPRAYYYAKNDGTYISRYPSSSAAEATTIDEIITIPEGVETLYVNQFLQTSEPFAFEKKANYQTYKRNSNWFSFDYLYGKKLACVGDSITEATNPGGGYFTNYAQIVAQRHSMPVYKDGIGGSTMANVSGHNGFSAGRYLNVPSDFDILTIWFGWNDATYAQVGTIDDTEDTTFYGGYNKVLSYFISNYPTKKIGLVVPYGNASVEPFRVAVRNLSEKFGVPCLDLADYHQCSCLWGNANASQEARKNALTYDGTHPNQAGHEYLSSMYEEFIKRL